MIKALEWWNLHRTSPGMDVASRRGLLAALQSAYSENGAIRSDCIRAGCKDEWDRVFGEETAALKAAIGEIVATLNGGT